MPSAEDSRKLAGEICLPSPVHFYAHSATLWKQDALKLHFMNGRRTTPCLKKVPTFKLSVTLSDLSQFSKVLHCCKAYEICYKSHATYPSRLRHVAMLHYREKLKNKLFCRYSADMEKMQTKSLKAGTFLYRCD